MMGHPQQPPHQARHMCAKDAPVGVHLVQHDVGEAPPHRRPQMVPLEKTQVDHLRVGEEDIRLSGADVSAAVHSHRATVALDADCVAPQFEVQPRQRIELVVDQRIDGIDVQRVCLAVRQDMLEHGEVVAKCLAAGGGGNDNQVLALARGLQRGRLVAVQALNAEPFQGLAQRPGQSRVGLPVERVAWRNAGDIGGLASCFNTHCRHDLRQGACHGGGSQGLHGNRVFLADGSGTHGTHPASAGSSLRSAQGPRSKIPSEAIPAVSLPFRG